MDASPSGLSLGNILENYPVILWVASEKKSKPNNSLGGKELEINLQCHQVYLWCISTLPQWENREGQLRRPR